MRFSTLLSTGFCLFLTGQVLQAQPTITNGNNELYFTDNGQIRSMDDNHRILFRRADNVLEFREYGRIIFSSGAETGTETAKMTLSNDGNLGIGNPQPNSKLDIKTTKSLDGIRIIHNDQGFVNLQSTSLGQSAYNNITQAGDAGIVYGSLTGNPLNGCA
ncbi:MAG: hypothetical protein ACJ751_22485 [Niastella sp.]|uniref:hypothetical protein n=1 Tax=Niastella sp. TaxID=1869183 RepID=UPI00389A7405